MDNVTVGVLFPQSGRYLNSNSGGFASNRAGFCREWTVSQPPISVVEIFPQCATLSMITSPGISWSTSWRRWSSAHVGCASGSASGSPETSVLGVLRYWFSDPSNAHKPQFLALSDFPAQTLYISMEKERAREVEYLHWFWWPCFLVDWQYSLCQVVGTAK